MVKISWMGDTYTKRNAKMNMTIIFLLSAICKFHTICTGSMIMTRSVMISIRLDAIQNGICMCQQGLEKYMMR